MSNESLSPGSWPVVLRAGTFLRSLSEHEFFEFCQLNENLRLERTSEGDLEILPMTGGTTGIMNASLTAFFGTWEAADGTGVGFASCTGFILPNGAMRSPDLAWIRRERWQSLTQREREEFPPLCPDFVVELRSPTDAPQMLHAKMREYIANGASLGWLIDPVERKVHVYRPSMDVVCLDDPATVSGEPILRGFVLDSGKLWG